MRLLTLAPLLLAACAGSTDSSDPTGSDGPDPRKDASTWPDTLGGDDRPANVRFPSNYDGESLLPVVMLLHGYSANAGLQELVFQLTPRIDRFGFVLILPEGTTDATGYQFWNATETCCNFYGSDVDDVGYLKGLLDEAEAAFPVDPDRVLVTGHSNGGFMSYRLACEDADRIDAIAPLAGLMLADDGACPADTPVDVLHIHGTADPDVPFDGWATAPGAVDSLERWTARAGCDGTSEDVGTADYEALTAGEETTLTRYAAGCAPGFRAELWSMEGVGHVPGFTDGFRDDLVTWLLAP